MSVKDDLLNITQGAWKFDEGEGLSSVDSHGSNNLTLSSDNVWDADGYDLSALNFDGVSTYTVFDSNIFNSPTTIPATYVFKLRVPSAPPSSVFFQAHYSSSGNTNFRFLIYADTNGFTIGVHSRSGEGSSTGRNYAQTTTDLNFGTNYWVVINHKAISGTGNWEIFVDNVQQDTTHEYTQAVDSVSIDDYFLGGSAATFESTPTSFTNIFIDEFYVFNQVLSNEQKDYLWNSGDVLVYPYDIQLNHIKGVVNLNSNPIEGAVVRLVNQDTDSYVSSVTTNSAGEYTFEELEDGVDYHVTVEYFDESTDEKYYTTSATYIKPWVDEE